ncbi:hemerythrin domain-containing protein, partial [Pseudomonadota bacterium]
FEDATGTTAGPTEIMRSEHTQMRDLLYRMNAALEQRDQDDYLGYSETLLIIMQQHNAKEEQMLYPMADQVLGPDVDEVIRSMEAVS